MNPHLVDTNVSFGPWPWMDFSGVTADALIAQLEAEGVAEAWVSATEAILFPDPDIPDARLLAAFRGHPQIQPVKTINPQLGNWRDSLQAAVGAGGFRLVRILPGYHLYGLIDLPANELAEALTRHEIPLIIQMRIEDERNQYPLMKVAPPPAPEIAHFAALHPRLKILALGATAAEIPALISGNSSVLCDLSFAECATTMENLLASIPAERLAFGSHSPFFYTRAAVRKLVDSLLSQETKHQIGSENARKFLARGGKSL